MPRGSRVPRWPSRRGYDAQRGDVQHVYVGVLRRNGLVEETDGVLLATDVLRGAA